MTFALSRPGTISDWIPLSSALLKYAEDKTDKSVLTACERLKGLDVKVKVLTRLQSIQLWDSLESTTTAADKIMADIQAMTIGLACIRGTDCDSDEIDINIIEALMASGVGHYIAMIIRSWQVVDQDQRAGFFTPEPAA